MNGDAIHDWFGLTYASYLVLPRSVLQSMPAGWQEEFVGLLRRLEDRLGHHYGRNDYRVSLRVNGVRVPDPLADYRHTPPLAPSKG